MFLRLFGRRSLQGGAVCGTVWLVFSLMPSGGSASPDQLNCPVPTATKTKTPTATKTFTPTATATLTP
ncbi:MAG TPA: hypothetical protein VI759_06685, partial [Dehalococcoidia bacterium]|nr:hypothetical protein [Dehalococcoidia bacterium]